MDPLDQFALILAARDPNGEIIGTVRMNFSRDGDLNGYDEFYAMASAGEFHPQSTSICTRLMIAPEYRRTLLAARLCLATYELGLENGITHNFIDCNDHLTDFFSGLGFIQHLPKKEHEEYGVVNCMQLRLQDHQHLGKMASPLLPALIDWQSQGKL